MWYDIQDHLRAGRECASKNCGRQAVAHFEHGGVGSDYCAECADKIERMRIKSAETNREIDELERIFGTMEPDPFMADHDGKRN